MLISLSIGSLRRGGVFHWMTYENTTCLRTKFLCNNKDCVDRHLYCDGNRDCGDNSDERQCRKIFLNSLLVSDRNRISVILVSDGNETVLKVKLK